MKPVFFLAQWVRCLWSNNHALEYVVTQLTAKAMAAVAQLYAIYVFSKILPPNDAALIFILLGYGVWVQVFELGLSQVIQNALNTKQTTLSGVCQIVGFHYILMILFAMLVGVFPGALHFLQGEQRVYDGGAKAQAFPLGIALLLISTNNVLVQRVLLVINRGVVASKMVLLQGICSVLVLMFFQWHGATFVESVAIYLAIPILIYAPLTLKLAGKALRGIGRLAPISWPWLLRNALGFWGLTALSSLYLGADYFFAAQYLTNEEMVAYHFSSRLFFISYVAYFSYVQYRAKGIAAETYFSNPQQVWGVARRALVIGVIAVVVVLVAGLAIKWSGSLDMIGASGLVVAPLLVSAALYYGFRVFRDIGLVIFWNFGHQKLLYVVHVLEVVLCVLLLNVLAPELGGKGIFFAMAFVAAVSTIVICIASRRIVPRLS
jgi:hypothetical protein